MSKKNDAAQQPATGSVCGDTIATQLKEQGTATLQAPTREALAEMLDSIPADTKYSAGAVGYNATAAAYTLRIDLAK